MKPAGPVLRREEYLVEPIPLGMAQELVHFDDYPFHVALEALLAGVKLDLGETA